MVAAIPLGVARKRAGVSLTDLSASTGVPVGTLWNWETGRSFPRRQAQLSRVARALRCRRVAPADGLVTLAEARADADLTLAELAALSNVPQGTLWNWESGRCTPRGDARVSAVARVLNIRPQLLAV